MGLLSLFSRNPSNNAALDGLRGSMCVWMIVFHTFFWQVYHITKAQNDVLVNMPLIRAFVLPGYMAVDVFFVLTGYLLAGSLFRKYLAAQQKAAADGEEGAAVKVPKVQLKSWVYRRAMRLLPMLVVALVLWCVVLFPQGSIPVDTVRAESTIRMIKNHFQNETHMPNGCNVLPGNLLFINQLLPFGGCMGYTWTLAIQFHFYLLLPLIWNFRGPTALVKYCFVAIVVAFVLRAYSQFQMQDKVIESDELGFFAFFWYSNTLTRIGPICMGVIAAWAVTMHKFQDWLRQQQVLVMVCSVLAIVFFWGGRALDFEQTFSHPLQDVQSMAISTLLHPGGLAVGLGITFIVLAVDHSIGHLGRALNSVFSAPFWAPIAELSYLTYLLHPMVMQKANAALFFPMTPTGLYFVFYATFNVLVTFTAAAILHVFIDRPVQALVGRKDLSASQGVAKRIITNILFVVYMLQLVVSVVGHGGMLYLVMSWVPEDQAADVATE